MARLIGNSSPRGRWLRRGAGSARRHDGGIRRLAPGCAPDAPLGASAATLLAVISGAASLGTAHELLSALALPPLVAIAIAAWLGHRRLLPFALAAIALFGAAALLTSPRLHLAVAAHAFAATVVLAALVHRGRPAPLGAWRDYLTLTKPRVMTLLLLTGACGMFVGARGVRSSRRPGRDARRPRARLRRRERAQPRARQRHRLLDGRPDRARAPSPPVAFPRRTRSSSGSRSPPCPSCSSPGSSTC